MKSHITQSSGSSSTPATFEHQPELRALLMLDTLPPGHMTFPVHGHHWWPHLRDGEFAAIDLSDRKPVNGELFLIAYSQPHLECGFRPALCQTRYSEKHGYWGTAHMFIPTDPDEYRRWMRSGQMVTSDGPFDFDHLASKLIGRVAGVYVPQFDARRAAA